MLAYLSTSQALVLTGRLDAMALDTTSGCLVPLHSYAVPAPEDAVTDPAIRFLFVGARRWDTRGADLLAFRIAADGALEPAGSVQLSGCCYAPGPLRATARQLFSLTGAASTGFRNGNALFAIDANAGTLTRLGPFTTAWEPVQIEAEPGHRFIYVQAQEQGGVTRLIHTLRLSASGTVSEVHRMPTTRPCTAAMDPRGDFVWMGCNTYDIRGSNGLPVFVEPFDAGAALVPHPSRDLLYRVLGGSIETWALDRASGRSARAAVLPAVASPVAATIEPFGRYLYVSNRKGTAFEVVAYAIDGSDGLPRELGPMVQGGPSLTLVALP